MNTFKMLESLHTNTLEVDIVICGAGPAGSTCALALANTGLSVALINKDCFPRDKICGGAIGAYVPKVLHTIHPKYAEAFNSFSEKVPVNTCSITAPNNLSVDFSGLENGHIAKRIDFDTYLVDLAAKEPNITLFENHTIKDVEVIEGHSYVYTDKNTFKSKLVIGCDGAHSIVAKKLTDTTKDLRHHSGAVRAYYKNVSGLMPQKFELHFIKQIPGGYFWIFPLKDNLCNVGCGGLSSIISKRKLNLRNILLDIIDNDPIISARFKGAEIVGKIEGFGLPLGSRKVTMSGDHFMLCGDAASLVDPSTGEGIGQAVVSGRYAGWHARKCFEKNDFSNKFMKEYDRQVYAKVWGNHKRSRFIQELMIEREWILNFGVWLARKSPFVRSTIEKILLM